MNVFQKLDQRNINYSVCSSPSVLAGSDIQLPDSYYILAYWNDMRELNEENKMENFLKNSHTIIHKSQYGESQRVKSTNRVEIVYAKPAMYEYDLTPLEVRTFLRSDTKDNFKQVLNSEEGKVWELKSKSFKEYINKIDFTIRSIYINPNKEQNDTN
tara:strand:+ start:2163 stop:2633 length:471 start_codon:yes stop_codon:yes gene_type:complete